MKKRTFTKEFKLAILTELDGGKSVAQVCTEHNIKKDLVYAWRREYKSNPSGAFVGRGNIGSMEAELNQYKRLVGELYAETFFLKNVCTNLRQFLAEQKKKERRGCIR